MSSSTATRQTGGEKNPIPIKSSLSVIFQKDHVCSNNSSGSCRTVTAQRMHRQQGPNVGGRGDLKERSANFTDVGPLRNMETLDTFAKCLVQRSKKKRIVPKKTISRIGKMDRKTKKSRQIFTFSRPTNFQPPGFLAARRPHNEGVEIYESSGGNPSCKDVEKRLPKSLQQTITFTPAKGRSHRIEAPGLVPLPRVLPAPHEHARVDPYDSKSSFNTQIFFPERFLIPSQFLPGACFPRTKSQPDLYYTISNQSIPLKNCTSAHSFEERIKKNSGGKYDMSPQTSNAGKYQKKQALVNRNPPGPFKNDNPHESPTRSNEGEYTSEMKNSPRGYKEPNDFVTKRMAEPLTDISILPRRGRLMDYAKFGSSFKISEDVYEDINCRSLSGMSKMAESMGPISFRGLDFLDKKLGYIHKVNPDFDDNQSLTEALTANRSPYQSSSMTSVALRSDLLTKVYQHFSKSVKVETSGGDETFSWIETPEHVMSGEMALRMRNKQQENESIESSGRSQCDGNPRFVDISEENISWVPRSNFTSGIRKQRLTELKISLKNGRYQFQKETDLWSSTNISQTSAVRSEPVEMASGDPVSRRKLCDGMSQTEIFNNSSVELFKRPFWKFKLGPVLDDKRAKLAQDFVSKAHHYMCGKDYQRMTLNRCYFRTSPAVRLTDQSTQFPDSKSKVCDRLVETKRDVDDEYVTVEAATYSHVVHENCTAVPHCCEHGIENSVSAFHCQTFESNSNVPNSGKHDCHKHVSRMSFTEINCLSAPDASSTAYSTKSKKMAEVPQGLVHSETVYENVVPMPPEQTSHLNLGGAANAKLNPVSHSFRAMCDKRRIHIKYKNGKYTVYKEVDRTRRQTVWSLLTGKATNLLSSVIPRRPSPHRRFRSHKTCS